MAGRGRVALGRASVYNGRRPQVVSPPVARTTSARNAKPIMQDDSNSHNQYVQNSPQTDSDSEQSWQAAALMHVATASIEEQRRGRRWRLFVTLAVLAVIIIAVLSGPPQAPGVGIGPSPISGMQSMDEDHVARIDVDGLIIGARGPVQDGIVYKSRVLEAMESAGQNQEKCKGIILAIDSPGGSVYESSRLRQAIAEFRDKHPNLPVYAMAKSITFSGGVYIAMGAEKFFAHKTSLVGSIGVVIASFGLKEAIDKLGVERRLIVSGPNKAILDPFSSLSPDHRSRIQSLVDEMYGMFVEEVKNSRGDRLVGEEAELFSGAFWTASQALSHGLIDGIGSIEEIVEQEFGTSNIQDYTRKIHPWESFFSITERFLSSSHGLDPSRLLDEADHLLGPGGDLAMRPYYLHN